MRGDRGEITLGADSGVVRDWSRLRNGVGTGISGHAKFATGLGASRMGAGPRGGVPLTPGNGETPGLCAPPAMCTRKVVCPLPISSPSVMVASLMLLPFRNVPLLLLRSIKRPPRVPHSTVKCKPDMCLSLETANCDLAGSRPMATLSPGRQWICFPAIGPLLISMIISTIGSLSVECRASRAYHSSSGGYLSDRGPRARRGASRLSVCPLGPAEACLKHLQAKNHTNPTLELLRS